MSETSFPDDLYAECKRLLSARPAAGQTTRMLLAQETLASIIVWEVILEAMWRLGAKGIAEGLWERLTKTVKRLNQTRQALEDQPEKPSGPEVEAVIREAREDVATLGRSLAPLKDGAGPEQLEQAKAAVQKVLVEAGWTETHAGHGAEEIVTFLTNRKG